MSLQKHSEFVDAVAQHYHSIDKSVFADVVSAAIVFARVHHRYRADADRAQHREEYVAELDKSHLDLQPKLDAAKILLDRILRSLQLTGRLGDGNGAKTGAGIDAQLQSMPGKRKIFFSYSNADSSFRDKLEIHLAVLKRQFGFATWHDREIPPGTEWESAIDNEIRSADIILLLISPDFLASYFCYDRELGIALERHRSGEATVIPIILRPCEWQLTSIASLQVLPSRAKAITLWRDKDAALDDVVKGIRSVI